MPLLDIRNLTIEFMTPDGPVKAVDRVSITLSEGEVRGLVGESGSGKSLIAKAICGVTKDNIKVTADRFRFDDIDLLKLSPRARRRVIGHNVSMIFQEPQSCLDPATKIEHQLIQAILVGHLKATGGNVFIGENAVQLSYFIGLVLKIIKISCVAILMS